MKKKASKNKLNERNMRLSASMERIRKKKEKKTF